MYLGKWKSEEQQQFDKICATLDKLLKAIENLGKEDIHSFTISDIDTSFPANGDLPFVQVNSPVLYVLVEWSDYAGSRHHTYLEYNYKTYSVKPEAKAE